MRILFLTQILPYPPDAGPRVKTWHVLRYLASRGFKITLVSFVRPEEQQHVDALREICHEVHTVPIRRSRITDVGYWMRSNVTGRPFLVERDDKREMRELVRGLGAREKVDVIHADQLGMAQFALDFAGNGSSDGPTLVFDAHNAVWTILQRLQDTVPWFLKPVAALEAIRIKRYEGRILGSFDYTLAVTEPDRKALVEAAGYAGVENPEELPIVIVPIAVDTVQLRPAQRAKGSHNIVTLGTLHYPPNADGIRWFAREVFPRIQERVPDVSLTIIGRNPPVDLEQMARENPDAIEVTGYVEDLDPFMDKAALMVVAVRAGGGMRVRILEAFARAMPVVTTTVGLEGIEAEPGQDVLVADNPLDFAEQVVQLLESEELQETLAERGRCLAELRYDWQIVLGQMEGVYPG